VLYNLYGIIKLIFFLLENENGSKYPEHLLISDITGNLYAFLIDSNSFLKPGTMIEPGVSLNICLLKDIYLILIFLDFVKTTRTSYMQVKCCASSRQ